MLVFWVVTPCGLVGRYQCFEVTYYLPLQGWSHFDGGNCFSETLLSTCKSTRRYYPEDQHPHLHRRENHKSECDEMFLSERRKWRTYGNYCPRELSWDLLPYCYLVCTSNSLKRSLDITHLVSIQRHSDIAYSKLINKNTTSLNTHTGIC
jgi:hypothetical protein